MIEFCLMIPFFAVFAPVAISRGIANQRYNAFSREI